MKYKSIDIEIEIVPAHEIIDNARLSDCGAQRIWIHKAVDEGILKFGTDSMALVDSANNTTYTATKDDMVLYVDGQIFFCNIFLFKKLFTIVE